MKQRVADSVSRPSVIDAYKHNMVRHLMMSHNFTEQEASVMVDKTVNDELRDRKVCSDDTISPGNVKTVYRSLGQFLNRCKDKVVTPSGSIYTPSCEKEAFVSKMIVDGLAERKAIKKQMFAAAEAGDEVMRKRHHYAQSAVKINLNSLPGGLGSPWNIFYDKGGYNAITSSARALIAQSYTITEELLGGNWPWFSCQEVLNHIYICCERCPAPEVIAAAVTRYHLKHVTLEMLLEYIQGILRRYNPRVEMATVRRALQNTPDHVIQFMYYLHNLRHLFWENEQVFKPWIRGLLTCELSADWTTYDPKQLWKVDEDLIAVVYTVMAKKLAGIKVSELVAKHPDLAKQCVDISIQMQNKLDRLEPLLEVFVYTDVNTHNVLTRKAMFRNTVIISDTDSVIFTAKDWVQWYVGQLDRITPESYEISALATYWLTKAVADTMAKFSIGQGATGERVHTMQMKNEFLYPVLIMYDTKKVYAGTITVQEGVVLPKAKTDLKGGAIRSSDVAKECRDFAEDLIVERILNPVMEGSISATELIDRVVRFEHKLINSIQNGGIEYLPRQSVDVKEKYAAPNSSAWAYMNAWNLIFAEEYEPIQPPDKLPGVKIITPNKEYFKWLQENNPKMYSRAEGYLFTYKKFPSMIVLSPQMRVIPPELLPIVDIRHIVFSCVKPVYLTLERLNIGVGFEKQKVMLSDVHPLVESTENTK